MILGPFVASAVWEKKTKVTLRISSTAVTIRCKDAIVDQVEEACQLRVERGLYGGTTEGVLAGSSGTRRRHETCLEQAASARRNVWPTTAVEDLVVHHELPVAG